MSGNVKYKFVLVFLDPGPLIFEVFPIYSESLSIISELETGERFFRDNLSDKVTFIERDFNIINNASFDTVFTLGIQESINGGPFNDIWAGKFSKTDAAFTQDDEKIEVLPEVIDQYTDILEGMDREFDLIKISPEQGDIDFIKRPILQIYTIGGFDNGRSSLTNIVGSSFWEENIIVDTNITPSDMANFGFSDLGKYAYVPQGTYAEGSIDGNYWNGPGDIHGDFEEHNKFDGNYYFRRRNLPSNFFSWDLVRDSDGTIIFDSNSIGPISPGPEIPDGFVFTDILTGLETFTCTAVRIFGRFVTTLDTFNGSSTSLLPASDIVARNVNYTHSLPADFLDTSNPFFALNDDFKTLPDGVGRYPGDCPSPLTNNYYEKFSRFSPPPVPELPLSSTYFPLAPNDWGCASIWFALGGIDDNMLQNVDSLVMRNNFTLNGVINSLIQELDTSIDHQATSDYSEFLYGTTNPVSGSFEFFTPASSYLLTDTVDQVKYFLAPKSNAIIGNFDQAAQKSTTTLKEILDLLKVTHRLFWKIENDKFIIEHVNFFNNGGNYTAPTVGDDLTTLLESRTRLPWSYKTNRFEFNKDDMPERFEYSWMDEVTDTFTGTPIEIVSKFVEQARVEDRRANITTTDIDFMLGSPSSVSKEGFFLGTTVDIAGRDTLPLANIFLIDFSFVKPQNVFNTWNFLHFEYHKFDLPADEVILNGVPTTLTSNINRRKIQKEIKYPFQNTIDPTNLIKTGLGNGEPEKISLNLTSRMLTVDLKHDTE